MVKLKNRFGMYQSELTELWIITDAKKKVTFSGIDDKYNCQRIVDLLNELDDENQELKFMLQNVSEQRDEFHCGARENARRVGELEKRVLELEKEVKALSNGEADWISEEYL